MRFAALFIFAALVAPLFAGTLTVQSNKTGNTPDLHGYNLGTFMPGSNTPDWWRYSGANSARMFLGPSNFATMSSNSVATQSAFLSARTALRANPLSSTYYNWTDLESRFENSDIGGYRVNSTISTLSGLGISMIMQITASESSLPIAASTEWRDKWRLWKHYYAMAFHLARHYDVVRYQIYNEPDHSNANGLTPANWLVRQQLATDAIRAAIADVNTLYSKNLAAVIYAPTTSGGDYDATWEGFSFANRHTDFLGTTSPTFNLFDCYDYHNYDSSPATFGSRVIANRAAMAAAMPGESPLPVTLSEFNVNTSSTLEATTETLDTPYRFSRLGGVLVNLASSGANEMWLFKFTQTASSGNASGVAKNGTHYADTLNFPYQHGGASQAAEVYRLFNKGFGPGREVLASSSSTSLQYLEFLAGRDPVSGRCYILSVNDTSSPADIAVNLAAWNIPNGSSVLLEEVSSTSNGAVALNGLTTVSSGTLASRTQPAYSVWLYTIEPRTASPALLIPASDDATVKDGTNKTVNYDGASTLTVKNNATSANSRNAALVNFALPVLYPPDLLFATLELQAATLTAPDTIQAHVYGVNNTSWSQKSVTWATTPNLLQGVALGNRIQNNVVSGAGTNAFIQGQLVVTGTTFNERQIDVTTFIRDRISSRAAGFLISQDYRWDVNIATGAAGDTQTDGIQIVSQEGDTGANPGPRLRIIRRLDTDGDGLSDIAETTVFGTSPLLADTDGDGVSDGAEYLAGTNPTNSDLVANPDSASTPFDTPVTISVLSNDTSQNGSPLSVTSATNPAHGNVVINNAATITYTPASGYAGPDSFTYTISNVSGGTATATVSITVNPVNTFTSVIVSTEATIESGTNADANIDEAALGYVSTKYSATGTKRKAYFQFDVSALALNSAGTATFNISFINSNKQRVQLWALNHGYDTFTAAATWNTAQANDTSGNGLSSGAYAIGASALLDPGSAPYTSATLSIPSIGSYVFGGKVTLVLAGVDDTANNSGGARYARAAATLSVPLSGNTPPTISDITNRTLDEDTSTGVIAFTIGDVQTAAVNLIVTATSSNPVKIPLAGLTLGGSDANRTIQVTPSANQVGQSAITVTVTDASGLSSSDNFIVTINAVNDAPVISQIPDQFTAINTGTSAVQFVIDDIDTPPATLSVSATSSNQSPVPDANILLGGTDTNRTVNITPALHQLGSANITVTVSDGSLSATSTFQLFVIGTAQESWTFTNFGSADTTSGAGASTADADADGLVNFLEYAFGGNPNLPDAANRAPFLAGAGGELRFTYRKAVTALSYSVEQSSTLGVDTWSPLTATESDNGDGTYSVNVPVNGGKQFLRLKVSAP
ncbi:hypothetical protein IMCC26134_02990 [Verrucomicrobia bacterium IMCC26134]|nr:hypothetical protein IMCC26134_02990 [Verrucomicrobia bacterium IMCC26134]